MSAAPTGWTLPLDGVIERRLLITYEVDPAVLRPLLPTGLRLQLVEGSAVAGICMIRLGGLRPAWLPSPFGWRGENAAHRIAVEWDEPDGPRTGVFVPERHSASWVPVAVGGRLFPGVHHHASFSVEESADRIAVTMTAPGASVAADVTVTDEWSSALFPTLDDASEFFRCGSVGWSPARHSQALEGLQLQTDAWRVAAARPERVASRFFDTLPRGASRLDHVLVMRDVPVRWTRPPVTAGSARHAVGARR